MHYDYDREHKPIEEKYNTVITIIIIGIMIVSLYISM